MDRPWSGSRANFLAETGDLRAAARQELLDARKTIADKDALIEKLVADGERLCEHLILDSKSYVPHIQEQIRLDIHAHQDLMKEMEVKK